MGHGWVPSWTKLGLVVVVVSPLLSILIKGGRKREMQVPLLVKNFARGPPASRGNKSLSSFLWGEIAVSSPQPFLKGNWKKRLFSLRLQ